MRTILSTTLAAVLLGYVSAHSRHNANQHGAHRHDAYKHDAHKHDAHQYLHLRRHNWETNTPTCGCTTTYTTYYGEPTLIQPLQQEATIKPVQSSTSAASFTWSTLAVESSPPAYVAPNSTPFPVESPKVAKPAAKPIEGTAPKPAAEPIEKSPSKPAAEPIEKSSPKPAAEPIEETPPKPVEHIASQPALQPSHTPAPKPAPEHKPIASGGSHWCMTYTPYNNDGSCKTSSSVAADVASIAAKGFSSIRLYSTDCSGLQNIGAAAKSHGLKLVLGVFISDKGISAASGQITEIITWASGNWDCVEMIVIGNEAIFNKYCGASELADFITSAKATFAKAGYSGPVTTTEPLNILTDNAHLLCPVVDIAAANIHPYFNGAVTAEGAGAFVLQELQLLETICPGLTTYNLETGWPSAGPANGAAVPGQSEQSIAIESIKKAAGEKCSFFSYADDKWKAAGGVEQSWGCAHLFE